ncbi:hypothetical protein PG994_009344 [Apiospora phragmitis]|uniref:Hsp70 family protein n=1 Tax=Apiospora phragmitis TaxID=2905665 RepID=A0ABR1ULC0_9PEZI
MSSGTDGRPPSDLTLVIGIDFGTTYSGVAYAITEDPDRRHAILTWPSSGGREDGSTIDKVPTTIRYLPQRGEFEWGPQISEETVHPDEIMRWFKLGLQTFKDDPPEDIRNMVTRPDSDSLVKDYLFGLGEHVLHFLRQRLGSDAMNGLIRRSAIQFVLTVPAVWDERAKDRTDRAFVEARNLARIGGVTLVSEPEAAATYALHTMLQESSLDIGQTFIVLDAGGGTVDIITYTITALHPVLQVREAVAATLANEEGFDNELLGRARGEFESKIKRLFSHASMPNGTFTVPLYGMANNREAGIRNGRLNLRASDVHAMYEPCVLKTIRLVKDQIRTAQVPINAVILIGGFGNSVYLRERLKKDIEDDMKVPIHFSKDSSLAVVYGAVMRGIAHVAPQKLTFLTVVERAARSKQKPLLSRWQRCTLEFTSFPPSMTEQAHRELFSKRAWEGMDGCWRVDAMRWFIRNGDRVAESQPYLHHFHQISKVSYGRPQTIFLTIHSDSKSNDAPLARNDNVDTLCHLEADISRIPADQLPTRRGKDGFDYYVLSCEIEVVYRSATTEYTLIHDNHRYSTVSAEYV